MSASTEIPLAGFSLERIYFSEQLLKLVPPDDLPPAPAPQIAFGWDWRIVEPRVFEIMMHIGLSPTRSRPEEVRVSVSGVFRILGQATSVSVGDFVRLQGPAILMPYLREGVSSLTGRGPFGQWILPPINVQVLMQQRNPQEATGAKQLGSAEGQKLLSS